MTKPAQMSSANATLYPVGQLATIVRGVAFRKSDIDPAGNVRVVRPGDIRVPGHVIDDALLTLRSDFTAKPEARIRPDDTLVVVESWTRRETGLVGMGIDGVDAVIGNAIAIVRPVVPFIAPRFLMFSLTTTRFADYVASVVDHGNRSDTVRPLDIENFMIPVPAMQIQREILAVLDPLCRQHAEIVTQIQDEILARRTQANTARSEFFERLEKAS